MNISKRKVVFIMKDQHDKVHIEIVKTDKYGGLTNPEHDRISKKLGVPCILIPLDIFVKDNPSALADLI